MTNLRVFPPHWSPIQTADGSPSLLWKNASAINEATSEAMHHQGGAWAETRYIYEPVIQKNFESRIVTPVFVSVGLGLAYNELLVAHWAGKLYGPKQEFQLHSYESDPWLRHCFKSWVTGQAPTVLDPFYDEILLRMGAESSFVKSELRAALFEKRWVLHGPLENPDQLPDNVTGFLWDAFSKKTSPQLWDQEFLTQSLRKAHPEFCYLSTYASLGSLKRALKENDFQLTKALGFKSKRGSTQAERIRPKP